MSEASDRTEKFANWLQGKMDAAGWSQSDLARRSGLTRQAIGNYVQGRRIPNRDAIAGIARAFDLDIQYVYKMAGLQYKHYNTVMSESDRTMLHLFTELDQDQQEELIELAKIKRRKRSANPA